LKNYTTVDPQTVAQISHDILETSPEHGHSISDQMGDNMGDKTGDKRKTRRGRPAQNGDQMGDKTKIRPRRWTQHPRLKNKLGDWEASWETNRRHDKDKIREANTASQAEE